MFNQSTLSNEALRVAVLRANLQSFRSGPTAPRVGINYRPLVFCRRGEVTASVERRGWVLTVIGARGSVRAAYHLLIMFQRWIDGGRKPAAFYNLMIKMGVAVHANLQYRQITIKL